MESVCSGVIDPKNTALWISKGLSPFKNKLFEGIGRYIERRGGRVIRGDVAALERLPPEIIPILGCNPELTPLILKWKAEKRKRIQWDRGYCRRVFATWLPRATNNAESFYRWHVDSFQLREIRTGLPDDRWNALGVPLQPWRKGGRHIVVAAPTPTYQKFHAIEGWFEQTLRTLGKATDRQIVVRFKDSNRPLQADLDGAHCLVAHGSIAAVEAAILGCPVFDHPESAAALVGLTDLTKIEHPIYPERRDWANTLAWTQFNEHELVNGFLWNHLQ